MFKKPLKKTSHVPEEPVNNQQIIKHARKLEGRTQRHIRKFLVRRWTNILEVRRNVVFWILLVAVLITSVGLQLMWCRDSYKTTASANNSTYAEGTLGAINTLNPLFATTSSEKSLSRLLFSQLLAYDTTGNLNYDLAANVTVSDAGKTYTVKLRDNAKWSDGEALTAQDVVFTVNLMKNSETRSIIAGWSDISVVALDDETVEFTLKSVYASFEHALTFAILPEHILKNVAPASLRESDFSQKPVTSGPFKLNFIQTIGTNSGAKVAYLVRNNDYYGAKVKLASFRLYAYPNTESIYKALNKNEISAAADLTITEAKSLSTEKYNVVNMPIQSGVFAILNTKSPVLNDVAVRRALQLATNTEAIRESLTDSTKTLNLPLTDSQLTGDLPTVPGFDLELAKKTLEEHGWKLNVNGEREKDGQSLKIKVVTTKSSEYEGVLTILSGQWRSLGVAIETQIIDTSDVTQNISSTVLQPRNYDVLLYQLDIGADPDVYAYWHSSQISNSGLNFANYSSIISNDALSSARNNLNSTLRNIKYLTFVKQWISDVPAIGLYQSTMQYASGKNVTTFDANNKLITATDRYSDLYNWSASQQSVYKTP